jgi:hypothetical protein
MRAHQSTVAPPHAKFLLSLAPVVGMHEVLPRSPDRLGAGKSGDSLPCRVQKRPAALGVDGEDNRIEFFDHAAQKGIVRVHARPSVVLSGGPAASL